VLVDLTMHMANGRPLLFAMKPAPVQVAWLAYPGTTGLSAMDYRLTDPWLDPPGVNAVHGAAYAETSIRLPHTFWCYDPLAASPEPGPLPALAEGHVTFGCLNHFCKVNPRTLALWNRVLDAVPGSRLRLLAHPGAHRTWLLEQMHDPGRVDFIAFLPRPDYLAQYRRIDLCLDTLPYNGHTTSLDAFWMGVPVVTRVGATVVGRAGWSQLNNLGLPELAAWNDDDYVRIAADLASDLPRLAGLRAGLRARMEASPLMAAPGFARALEAAYRGMVEEHRAQGAGGAGNY
jgi:predicted O-linked N-acetylglucosamine transferase (SPINDLY family)